MTLFFNRKARDHALRQAVYDGDYDKYKSLQEEYDYQLFYHLKADSVQVTWGDTFALRNKSWVRRELGIRSFRGLYNE